MSLQEQQLVHQQQATFTCTLITKSRSTLRFYFVLSYIHIEYLGGYLILSDMYIYAGNNTCVPADLETCGLFKL